MKRKLWKIPIPILIAITLAILAIGTVGALNGWFGGGASIPSDTFTRGLVGYWSFDEGGGQYAYDGTGNSNTGTLGGYAGATSSDPKWASGKVAGALQFDGTDDYVSLPQDFMSASSSVTIELWAKANILPTDASFMLSIEGAYVVYADTDGTSYVIFDGASPGPTSTTNIVDEKWHQIVGTSDGSTSKIYIDGNLENSGAETIYDLGLINRTSAIGSQWDGSLINFNGLIDEVRIYNRALSAAEIRYHYNCGGPVAHWTFDEGNGTTTYDMTDNNNDGILGDGVTATSMPSFVAGKYGTALSFDGKDDYVDVGDRSVLDFGSSVNFSISTWIKKGNIPSIYREYIISKRDTGAGGNAGYELAISNAGGAIYFLLDSGTPQVIFTGSNIADGKWHHIVTAVDRDSDIATIYLDGVYDASKDISSIGDIDNTGNFIIGTYPTAGADAYFEDIIDDVRIYNYARTADEIVLDYNAGFAARFGPQSSCDDDPGSCMDMGLVGYLPFDEGSGSLAYDASENNNDGTLGGYAGATSSDPRWTTGIKPLSGGVSGGGALQFDGRDDYMLVADDTGINNSSELSVEAWIKPDSVANLQSIISDDDSVGDNRRFGIRLEYNALDGWILGNSSVLDLPASGTITPGVWHHIAMTYEEDVLLASYINGEVATSAVPDIGNIKNIASDGTYIGAQLCEGCGPIRYYFNGLIDEVRIYNRALSAEEIRYHYNRGGPVAHWRFDEGNGTTTYDSSNNSNDGVLGDGVTATSTPTWTTGKYGTALEFDGVDDYVDAGTGSSLDMEDKDFTLEAWVNPSTYGTEWDMFIGAEASGAALGMGDDHKLKLTKVALTDAPVSDVIIPLNTWTHVGAVFDSHKSVNNLKYFVNGVNVKTVTFDQDFTAGRGTRYVGACPVDPDWVFKGLIDDVRIHNYARTPSQIQQDYNEGAAARFGPVGEGITTKDCDNDPSGCMDYGLVGYWDFEEGGGTYAYDNSDYSNTGTLGGYAGATSSDPRWTTGIKPLSGGISGGGALQFDGTDDYAEVPDDASLNITESFSLEAWIKPAISLSSMANYPKIVDKLDASVPRNGYSLEVYGAAGKLFFLFYDSGNTERSIYASAADLAPVNQWTHVVGVYDKPNGTLKLFINGAIDNTANVSSQTVSTTANPLRIGAQSDWLAANLFDGVVDDMRIYNRALSVAEIRYHYNRGGPVAHWRFDEGDGQIAFDESNNSNDGQLGSTTASDVGDPTWVQGKYGSALSFDGVDGYVKWGTNVFNNSSFSEGITISAWINVESFESFEAYNAFVSMEGRADFNVQKDSHKLRFYFGDPSSELHSSTALEEKKWYHVLATWSSSTEMNGIYINGKLDNSITQTTTPDLDGVSRIYTIGAHCTLNNYFNGLIDDVRIYNYARTPSQILQDYNAGLSTYFR